MTVRTMLGRERELSVLEAATERAERGRAGALVLVEGAAGEGKSSLVETFVSSPACHWAVVLRGGCSAVGTFLPFEPFVLALNQHALETDPVQLGRRVGDDAGVLLQLVPNLGRALGSSVEPEPLDRMGSTARLRRSLVSVFERLAADGVMVLVLEDLHWAGDATLELLADVMEASAEWRLVVIATVRSGEVAPTSRLFGLVEDLRAGGRSTRLGLGGLDRAAVSALAERVAGRPVSDGLLNAVAIATEGNPLFVTEYVRHLREHHALDAGWDELVVPGSVQAVISKRIGRLDDASRRALQVAALLGRDFSLDAWAAVSGIGDAELAVAVAEGVGAGVIEPVSEAVYTFTHALIADGFTDALTSVRRKRLHRDVGAALESYYGEDAADFAAELAHHFSLGGATVRERVVHHATLAGRQALMAGDYASSERLLTMALDQISALDRGVARDHSEFELRLGLIAAEMSVNYAEPEGAVNWAERARASVPRIMELLDGAGRSELALVGLSVLANIPMTHGDIDVAAALFARSLELAEALDSPGDIVMHLCYVGLCCTAVADCEGALKAIDRSAPLLSCTPVPSAPYWQGGRDRPSGIHPDAVLRAFNQTGLWLAGRYRQAFEFHADCGRAIETMRPEHQAHTLAAQVLFAMLVGLPVEALETADRAIGIGTEVGRHFDVLMARLVRGRALSALGDPAGLADLEEILGWWRLAEVDFLRPTMLCLLAESRLDHQDPGTAAGVLDEADLIVARTGQRVAVPEILRLRGEILQRTALAGDDDAWRPALDGYRSAVDAAAAIGLLPYEQRAATRLAGLLMHLGQTDGAIRILRASINRTTDAGSCPDLEAARAALARITGPGARRASAAPRPAYADRHGGPLGGGPLRAP